MSVLLLGSFGAIVSLAHKPIQNRYIRIDEMGRAQAIQYTDLNYSPREGEVRTYLTDWANYRFTINRDTITKKYPLNYYFFSQQLSTQLMSDDNAKPHCLSGHGRTDRAERRGSAKRHDHQHVGGDRFRAFACPRERPWSTSTNSTPSANSHEPRTEHWMLSVTYYLNPKQVSDQSRVFPQFETINPLGMTITEFHENRIGVDPIADSTANPRPVAQTLVPGAITAPTIPGGRTGAIR